MHIGAWASRRLILLPPFLVALLVVPFVLDQNAWWEWANPYWFLGRQAAHVSGTGFPTLFLQLETGTFNPYFVYYAGPMLSLLAYPAAVFGAWPVFIAATAGALVGGYFGVWWAARTLGLSGAAAVLPALAFAATPFLVSTLYDRGAWAELVAGNAAAVLLAGLLAVVFRRPGARDTGGLIAILGASAVIAGTHNLTVLMAAVVLPFLLLALLPLRPPGARPLGRALARAAVAGALGIGLTAAWLLPNLWYGHETLVAQPNVNDEILADFPAASPIAVLTPWPHVSGPIADAGRDIHPQIPALVLLWAIAVLGVLLARRRAPARVAMTAGALAVLGAVLIVLVAQQSWWLHFPAPARAVQYPFRLLTYVSLVVVLGAAVALSALGGGRDRGGRWAVAALGLIVAVQLGFAASTAVGGRAETLYTNLKGPREADARAAKVPAAFALPTMLTPLQFRVSDQPTGATAASADAEVAIGDPLTSDRATLRGSQPVGSQVLVPVVWSPFVTVTGGASLAGRDGEGMVVVEVTETGPDGRWTAEVAPTTPWPLALGRGISAVTAAALLALAVAAAIRRSRGRRRRTAAPGAAGPEPDAALVTADEFAAPSSSL